MVLLLLLALPVVVGTGTGAPRTAVSTKAAMMGPAEKRIFLIF